MFAAVQLDVVFSVQSLMGWLKGVLPNMPFADVTADKFQPARLELNNEQPVNMLLVSVHLLMFQLFKGWLNVVQARNMLGAVQLDVVFSVQSLMGWLKAKAFWNIPPAVVIDDKFQPARLELNEVARLNM